MKKRIRTIIASVLCASLMLAGCANDNNKPAASGKPAPITSFKCTESTGAGNSGDVKLEKGDTYAVISVRDYGDIKVKLYPDLLPYSTYNFVELAKKGTYDGYTFHRIVDNFMIQAGSKAGGGKSIDGGSFKNEVNTSLRHYYGALCYSANGLGDLTDGFYIVNSKTLQNDIDQTYDLVNMNLSYYSAIYDQTVASIDPSMDNYEYYRSVYSSMRDYNKSASEASAAMKKTITDAVTKTYAEKGGKAELDGCYTVFGQTVEGFDVIDKISAVEKEESSNGELSKPLTEIVIDKVEIFTME